MALNFGSIFKKLEDTASGAGKWLGGTAQGLWNTASDVATAPINAGRLGVANLTGNQGAANNARQQLVQNYRQGALPLIQKPIQGVNTLSGLLGQGQALGDVGYQSIFGNDQSYANARKNLSRTVGIVNSPNYGLLGQGGLTRSVNDPVLTGKANVAQFGGRFGAEGAQLAPYFLGGGAGAPAEITGLNAVGRFAAAHPVITEAGTNTAIGTLGSAGQQYADTGKVDWAQAGQGGASAALQGLVMHGGKVLLKGSTPQEPLKPIANDINPADLQGVALQSHLGKTDLATQQAADLAASKARAINPEVQAKKLDIRHFQDPMKDLPINHFQEPSNLKIKHFQEPDLQVKHFQDPVVKHFQDGKPIAQDIPESWLKPKSEGDKALNSMVTEAADALKSYKDQTGGVSLIPGEGGNKVRASANPQWYRDFYAKNGRAPNKGELKTIAYNMLENKDPQITNLVDAELYHATKQMAKETPKPKVVAKSNPNIHIPSKEDIATGGVTPENMAKYNLMDSLNPKVVERKVNIPKEPTVVTGNPAKHPAVQEVLQALSKARGKSNVEASLASANIEAAARKLKVNLKDKNFLDNYETGNLTGNEAKLAAVIKSETEKTFGLQQQLTPEILHRENYIPHSYAQGDAAVQEAARRLQTATGADKSRTFNTYAEARDYGLAPKRDNLAQMIGENTKSAHTALLNQEVVKKGMENGLFDTSPVGNKAPVTGLFHNGDQIYAQKSVADTLNGVLQKDSTGLAKVTHKAASLSEKAQDVMLQGGIPGTNANFFVAGQLAKDTTRNVGKILHPIQAVKQEGHLLGDFFRGKKMTANRMANGTFKTPVGEVSNPAFIREMADRGLYITPQTAMSGIGKGKVSRAWDSLGNNPTFGRYMPNRLLSTAQEVYSQSVKKLGHEKALDLAAETTRKFTGQVDQIAKGRSNLTQDAIGAVAFAPKYRESIINALNNVVKSTYPKNWMDKSYAPSRQLLAGMAVTLAGYEALNQQLTGHSMMENRQGQELSLEIPYGEKDAKGNQPVINVPFMPGFMTIPRAMYGAATSALRGDVKGVVSEASKGLSAPLQTGGNVLANQDYFGRPIYNDQKTADANGIEPDSAGTAAGKVAAYVGGQFSPAWVRGAIDKASGKPTEQAIATALEAPVRFGKHMNPTTQAYFKDRDEIYQSLDKNDKAVWDSIHPQVKNVNGEYMVDKTVDSGLARASNYLNNPNVLKAENEMAKRAQARGEAVDPLFTLPGNQQRIALRIDTLPPKDPNKIVLRKENPWYADYTKARSDFFDKLPPGDPNKPKGPIAYPEASAQVESLRNAYYQATDPAMKRQILTDNPGLSDQFAKEEQYSRAVRAAKDLPQYDKYPEPPKDVQNLIDFYSALPKGEGPNGKSPTRSAWIKAHPAEWDKMTAQFSKQAEYGLQQDMQVASFEGQDPTAKGIKDIKSLAQSLGMIDNPFTGSGGGSGKVAIKDPRSYGVSLRQSGNIKVGKVAKIASPARAKAKVTRVASSKPKVSLKKALV